MRVGTGVGVIIPASLLNSDDVAPLVLRAVEGADPYRALDGPKERGVPTCFKEPGLDEAASPGPNRRLETCYTFANSDRTRLVLVRGLGIMQEN